MSKEEMLEYITDKLPELGYIDVEMVYGLIQGITGADPKKSEHKKGWCRNDTEDFAEKCREMQDIKGA